MLRDIVLKLNRNFESRNFEGLSPVNKPFLESVIHRKDQLINE